LEKLISILLIPNGLIIRPILASGGGKNHIFYLQPVAGITTFNYKNGLSNLKSKLAFRSVFLALLVKTRNFCVYRIFCNKLTNENLAEIKVLKRLFAM